MSSEIKADKWSPASGTSATIGDSGDTFTVPSGVTLDTSSSTLTLPSSAITGQTAITSLADTDKFLVSDASDSGNLKYVEKQYLPSGGFVRVGGGSASGQNLGTLSFDNFSSIYNFYYVQYRINFVADGSQLLMRVRDSSGFKTNAGYFFGLNGVNQSGTNSDINGAGSTSFRLSGGTTSNDGHHSCIGNLWFYYPYDSSKVVAWTGSAQETDESYVVTSRWGGGEYQVAETTVGFGFTGNTQNIEQYNVQIFGVKES
jgi:hypothetical protein